MIHLSVTNNHLFSPSHQLLTLFRTFRTRFRFFLNCTLSSVSILSFITSDFSFSSFNPANNESKDIALVDCAFIPVALPTPALESAESVLRGDACCCCCAFILLFFRSSSATPVSVRMNDFCFRLISSYCGSKDCP